MPNDEIAADLVTRRAAAGAEGTAGAGDDEPSLYLAPPFVAALPVRAAGRQDLPAVPGYESLRELGRGGMGVVYQARHAALNRMVALKMILAGLHAEAATRNRFQTEARAIARLQHPHIVQIYDVGEYDGKPFVALEYVEGGSLLHKVAGTPQPEAVAARLVEQVARAVHYMHQRGIVHRDLKPTNVLLTMDGTPKIADFGLAKMLDAEAGASRSETLLGTPSYMAPEQAAGDARNIGAPCDIYALGAILYELLTGRAPFRGATALSTLEQVRTRDPVAPRRLRSSVSFDLETICLKCLQKEPARRYDSAAALADDLQRFLDNEPILARPVPVWQRVARVVRRRPARIAWTLFAAVSVGLLLTAWSGQRAVDQLADHRANTEYQQFVQRRNEALLFGILAADEGAVFLATEVGTHRQRAASAASEALALAGVDPDSEAPLVRGDFRARSGADAVADCYTLLLVLAATEPDAAALQILDAARRLGLVTRAYHLRRAQVLESMGMPQDAHAERERAADIAPCGALDHWLIGEGLFRQGQWQEAMSSFNRCLLAQPSNFWGRFFLAVCHLKTQQWPAAREGLSACLGEQPDFVWAYVFRSLANEKLQARAESEADLQKALGLNPSDDARYVLFLTRGILHFNQQDLRHAEADFRSALALKPRQYNAYLNLAHVHLARGEFAAAAAQIEAALPLQPPAAVIAGYQLERARRLLHNRRYEDAIAACAAALEVLPGQAPPDEVRGRALLALGRHAEAENAFSQYLRLGGAGTSDVYRGRGSARMQLGKFPEAVEDYTRALATAPDADIYQHRGWAHFFCDAWKLAHRDFAKAIELDPAAPDAYSGRGLASVMLGDYRTAVADADAAIEREPKTPEMMHNLACIFAQAAARAEGDVRADDGRLLAAGYRRRASEALRETLAMVPPEQRCSFWHDKVLSDAALVPIRNDPEFQRLQAKYGNRL
jgi:serine/threonine-protein kinase